MLARLAYGFHFGVRAGVACRSSALDAFSDDFVATDDQRANRRVAGRGAMTTSAALNTLFEAQVQPTLSSPV